MLKLFATVITVLFAMHTAVANTYEARVHRVMDGDTIYVCPTDNAIIYVCKSIRVNGINTPEKRVCKPREMSIMASCEPCQKGATLGIRAKDFAKSLFEAYPIVTIETVAIDRYNRAVANVFLPDGRSFADIMLSESYAAPYTCKNNRCGPRPRPWC